MILSQSLLFLLFCEVGGLAMLHKRNEPNLVRRQKGQLQLCGRNEPNLVTGQTRQ
jgi:hypothetical protein